LEREKTVGSFNVDLFCEDGSGNYVIIENQLERSDHDHLGKLLTYMVNLEARTAIWVTPEVRPEHERVIDWLNEATSADFSFYLVRIEAVRIGSSPYAPLFTVLAAPDEQTREIGETKKELADRHYRRLEFWEKLLAKSRTKTKLFSSILPKTANSIAAGAGKTGFQFGYSIRMEDASVWVGLVLDDEAANKKHFDELFASKEAIEAEFGGEFFWESRDGQVRLFVYHMIVGSGGLATPEKWDALQEIMVDKMINLDQAFRPRIANLEI
jgi:hypothetical protein